MDILREPQTGVRVAASGGHQTLLLGATTARAYGWGPKTAEHPLRELFVADKH